MLKDAKTACVCILNTASHLLAEQTHQHFWTTLRCQTHEMGRLPVIHMLYTKYPSVVFCNCIRSEIARFDAIRMLNQAHSYMNMYRCICSDREYV